MKLTALMAARNEEWIIGLSLRAALRWCDDAVVLLHCCTDGTADIVAEAAEEHPGRVHMIVEPNPNWREMDHRQRMLREARRRGATHIANVDADEILTGNLLPHIREHVARLRPRSYMRMGMFCMWRSFEQYRDDVSVFGRASTSMLAFADDKTAIAWEARGGYQHHHREPYGSREAARISRDSGGIMHLQWVDWRRLVAKQTWYQCMERVNYPNKPPAEIAHMYSQAMSERGIQLALAPADWWTPYADILRHANLDGRPWHEGDVDRMMAERGAAYFDGLNLAYRPNAAEEVTA